MSHDAAPTINSAEAERHATNLELFLDLVFVFAITQIATMISHHPSAAGTARAFVVTLLVWWQWSQFTWAGSAIDLQRQARTRVLVLCLIPVTLLAAIAIPEAYHSTGFWFAGAYFGVQILVLGMHGSFALLDPVQRLGFVRYGSLAVVAPAVVLAGAFFHGHTREGLWALAAAINLLAGMRAGGGEWAINPVHFAERHALFMIIALGEVLVAAGGSATSVGLDGRTALALIVCVGVACMLWWAYFAFIPEVGEHRLRRATGEARGVLARDMYTFGHFPLVFGLVLYAVVVKHLVPHPNGHLLHDDRWLLGLSVVFFVGGLLAIQYRVVRTLAPERIVAIPVAIGLCALGGVLPALAIVALVAVTYSAMTAITWHRYRASR